MIAPQTVSATLSRSDASAQRWDFGIIGAGVAGASLAIHLAQRGHSVLLVESQRFPREKVCGGCLNQRAITALDSMGVLQDCMAAGAVEIETLRIRQGKREHRWTIPTMLSMRRSTLDTILVKKAIADGAHYLDQTFASIDSSEQGLATDVRMQLRPRRTADNTPASRLNEENEPYELRVGVAIVAAGLTRSPLTQRGAWPATIEPHSRIGVQALIPAAVLDDGESSWHEIIASASQQELRMLVGTEGYLGISRADGEFYDFAAALDPAAVTRHRSVAAAIDALLDECGLPPIRAITPERWKSTPHLTRRSWPVAKDRVFLIGDSMGYVEPFTGEGMSWAMAGAKWLSDQLDHPAVHEVEAAWNQWAGIQRRHHQSVCQWVASQIRYPIRTAWVLTGLDWIPPVRNLLLRKATQ